MTPLYSMRLELEKLSKKKDMELEWDDGTTALALGVGGIGANVLGGSQRNIASGGGGLIESLKTANISEDLPWYTTALGATGGSIAASKLAPKAYLIPAQIGGALIGTAAGLEAGKAIGRKLTKTAAPQIVDTLPEVADQVPQDDGPKPPPPPIDMAQVRKGIPHPAVIAGKSILGLGIGMGAGYAGMQGADYALRKLRGEGLPKSKIMWAVPATTAALGLAYPYWSQSTVDRMRQAHLDRQEAKRGRKGS